VLLVVGLAVVALGGIGLLRPFERNLGTLGVSDCGTPIAAAVSPPSDGWIADAPSTEPVVSGRLGCRDEARRRVAFGAALVGVGSAGLMLAARRPPSRGYVPLS
jgi:hypothetical protein